jgi:hypothetical protein
MNIITARPLTSDTLYCSRNPASRALFRAASSRLPGKGHCVKIGRKLSLFYFHK